MKKINKSLISFFLIIGIVLFYNRRKSDLNLKSLKDYVINITPCLDVFKKEENKGVYLMCSEPPIPPKEIQKLLETSKINDDYKKSVLLIFLKLYRQQIIRYHQSFDVRESPFFINRFKGESSFAKALCEIVGHDFIEKKLGPEFLPAI